MFSRFVNPLYRAGIFRSLTTVAKATSEDWKNAFYSIGTNVDASLRNLTPESGVISSESAGEKLSNCPQLRECVQQLKEKMLQQGFIPFIHAFPASHIILLKLEETIHSDNPFPLRSKRFPFTLPMAEAVKYIPIVAGARNKQLMSAGYDLYSGCDFESPAGWLGAGHVGNNQNADFFRYLTDFFAANGYSQLPGFRQHMEPKFLALGSAYARLEIGNVAVIGIPENILDGLVYDSKPYNVRSGRSIKDVLKQTPAESLKQMKDNKCVMASMLLCEEFFTSGVKIEVANDVQVQRDKSNSTPFETALNQTRKKLNDVLEEYIAIFAKYKNNPHAVVNAFSKLPNPAYVFDPVQDFPQNLP